MINKNLSMKVLQLSVFVSMCFTALAAFSCSTNEDCQFHVYSRCSSGSCTSCTTYSHCSHISGADYCYTIDWFCHIPCSGNHNICKNTLTYCNTNMSPPYCRMCINDGVCSDLYGPGAKCISAHGAAFCGLCTSNSECSDGKVCNSRFQCVPCTATNQCTSPLKCNTATGKCVECLSNSHCTNPASPICSSNICVPCTGPSQCPSPFKCNTASGRCVSCLDNSHCSNPTPVCSTTSYTFISCTATTQCSGSLKCSTATGRCEVCVDNSHCSNSNPVCSTSTYPIQRGHWKS